MGQQQLLLLVMGIVIVALGIAGGVQAYGVGKVKSQQDDFALEAMEIAFEVLAWQKRHPSIGGNQGRSDLSRLSLTALGRQQDGQDGSVSHFAYSDRMIVIDASNGQRPLIEIRANPLRTGAQSYELAMYGEDDECWAFLVEKFDGSSWSLISGTDENPDSANCAW